MTLIALGSTSAIKVQAVQAALEQFGIKAEISAVKAVSGIAEQPFDDETITGAKNRARHAAQLAPNSDFALAIESGIFTEGGRYFDRAIAVVLLSSGEFISALSEPVEFPADAVEETIRRGVDVWTCGKVMAEWQLVEKHDDPHLSLAGIPRAQFLNQTVAALFATLHERGLL